MEELQNIVSSVQFEQLVGWLTAFISAGGLYFAFQIIKLVITLKKSDRTQAYLEEMEARIESKYQEMIQAADERYQTLHDELEQEQSENAKMRMNKIQAYESQTNAANVELQNNVANFLDSIDE